MTTHYVPEKTRLLVKTRAKFCCEYCLLPENLLFFVHEAEHIISLKQGGLTILSNLACACALCNRYKGSDVGSIINNRFVRFFNPRKDKWHEHFALDDAEIIPLTNIGKATVQILQINDVDRLIERRIFQSAGLYPPAHFKY
jgi:hypothetical protein